ncbi:type II secretion system minor pseudopilin GspI [Halioxenophilus aromaticivorans]|uniref:Type II secretion system protein I n=1 Tax=Halioxenophilus aromaticivorans TaxID=1306992 RepID=A0AAV3U604_9ALTE
MHRAKHQRGFTLIEVMVALGIIAFALPALIAMMSTQANNVIHIREQTIADWVAVNQLNAQRLNYRLTGRVLNGRETGTQEMAGFEWHFLVDSKVTDVDELRRITVKVSRNQEQVDDNPTAELSGFVYEPKPQTQQQQQ